MVQLRIISEHGSNRLGYERLGSDQFVDVTHLIKPHAGDQEKLLTVINKILADFRSRAIDGTNGDVQYKGAALLRTEQGNWFAMPNLAIHDDELQRPCAELNTIRNALEHEQQKMRISELWFMGGREDSSTGREIDARPQVLGTKIHMLGKPATPCGNCRDVIRKYGTPATIVHMVPVNDGTVPLLPGDPASRFEPEQLEPNRIFSRTIGALLPNILYSLDDSDDSRKAMMRKAYAWVRDADSWVAIGEALDLQKREELAALELEHASPDDRLKAVNRYLMETARDYIAQDREQPVQAMTIAVVRTADGKYYMGKHAKDDVTSAAPLPVTDAINEAKKAARQNRSLVTDVFIVNFSREELGTLAHAPEGQAVGITMPNGASRETLKKFSPRNGVAAQVQDFFHQVMNPQNGGNMHVFLPNNPEAQEFDPQKHVVSMTIKELLPYAYQHPKGNGNGNHTPTPTH